MSATLAARPLAKLLGNDSGNTAPIVHAEGRRFPVQVRYERRRAANGSRRRGADAGCGSRTPSGHVLVSAEGVGEILRVQESLASLAERQGLALLPLFGDLPAEQQDRVLTDLGQRKVILATNVAETSLTIEGVTAVIDSGQARQLPCRRRRGCRDWSWCRFRRRRQSSGPGGPGGRLAGRVLAVVG